jgi:hypothetical protein
MSDKYKGNQAVNDTPRTDAAVGDSQDRSWMDGTLCRKLERELNSANARIKLLNDCLETAWGIIANVSGGDWTEQNPKWQKAVIRWRDNQFHPIMKNLSGRKAEEIE